MDHELLMDVPDFTKLNLFSLSSNLLLQPMSQSLTFLSTSSHLNGKVAVTSLSLPPLGPSFTPLLWPLTAAEFGHLDA